MGESDLPPEPGDMGWASLDQLTPWEANPRLNGPEQVAQVARSIERFGWAAPIVARPSDGRIIAGHTRYLAARELDLDRVPVRWLELPDEEATALTLADNLLTEATPWDEEGLGQVLRDLAGEEVDLEGLGLGEEDLDRYLERVEVQGHTRSPATPRPDPRPVPGSVDLRQGDALEVLRTLPDASVDSVVTDPPYGLGEPPKLEPLLRGLLAWLTGEGPLEGWGGSAPGFMGRQWDSHVPSPEVWEEVHRVLKPGGHLVAFSSTRTVDLLGLALRAAGFELRDLPVWVQWQGFPKNMHADKAIDRHLGGDASEEAAKWEGWGTALKPANEPMILARKPLAEDSVAAQVLATGTGALHLDACRVAPGDPLWPGPQEGGAWGTEASEEASAARYSGFKAGRSADRHPLGYFPANLVHVPKASRSEREAGCEAVEPRTRAEVTGRQEGSAGLDNPRSGKTARGVLHNDHPTVKPLRLTAWLVRLVTPPGGLVLDPYMGSGTTGAAAVVQGFRFLGVDREERYLEIAGQRIAYWTESQEDALDAWRTASLPDDSAV